MFILSAQRRTLQDVNAGAQRYAAYLEEHRASFPAGAYALATAD